MVVGAPNHGELARYGGDRFARLEGLHLHIGSPIYTVDPYREALAKTVALVDDLAADGHAIRSIDLGGGSVQVGI